METISLLPQQRIESIVLLSETTAPVAERRTRSKHASPSSESVRMALEQDLESVLRKIRGSLSIKRREIGYLIEDYSAALTTPLFEYSVRADLPEGSGADFHWVREVSFFDPNSALANTSLLAVFADEFDAILVRFAEALSIPDWIDSVEERQTPGVSIDYDLRCSWCELSSDSAATTLRLEGRELRISRKPGTDATLQDMAQWVVSRAH